MFFKINWDIVKYDVTDAVKWFFLENKLPRYVNSILLKLIPKKFNVASMKDFRLISCCKVLYKVVSKVLENRHSQVLPYIIGSSQTPFIKGRYMVMRSY
ncbi:hypothetical protein LINPERHAP2_LOCUS31763 [Linum perenne]